MKKLLTFICAFVLIFGIIENSSAKSLLVSGGHHYICPTYTTGFEVGWDEMTLALKSAFDNNVEMTLFLEDWNQIVNYDALWIDARDNDAHPDCDPRWLSELEIENIEKFIGLGRPVVMVGEHDGWSYWNSQLLSIVGGSYNPISFFDGLTIPVVTNELTVGVNSISYRGSVVSSGGTALFDQNFAILWGDNVLIVLDTDLWANHRWDYADNSQFGINVANWIADTPILDENQAPTAVFGPDQVVFDEVTFDGRSSYDPDGWIDLYEWKLEYIGDPTHDKTAIGENPTIIDLYPGVYNAYLTVTDNNGAKGMDYALVSAAGPCPVSPIPDEDEDGVPDITDLCLDTPPDTVVDSDGCSLWQFCTAIDTSSHHGRQICNRSDWKNDEPLKNRGDCKAVKQGKGPSNYKCVPR